MLSQPTTTTRQLATSLRQLLDGTTYYCYPSYLQQLQLLDNYSLLLPAIFQLSICMSRYQLWRILGNVSEQIFLLLYL